MGTVNRICHNRGMAVKARVVAGRAGISSQPLVLPAPPHAGRVLSGQVLFGSGVQRVRKPEDLCSALPRESARGQT